MIVQKVFEKAVLKKSSQRQVRDLWAQKGRLKSKENRKENPKDWW